MEPRESGHRAIGSSGEVRPSSVAQPPSAVLNASITGQGACATNTSLDHLMARPPDSCLFRVRNYALQVRRFGNAGHRGMILALAADLQQADAAMRVARGFGQHVHEFVLGNVMRTRATDEDSARLEHLQRT